MTTRPMTNRLRQPNSTRAMTPDSEEEFYDQLYGPLPSLNFSEDRFTPVTRSAAPRVARPRRSRLRKDRQLSEKGIGTDASDYSAPALPPPPSSDEEYATAAESVDTDIMEVETMLADDTDVESPPSRTASFTFNGPSRSGTLTSIGPASSSTPRGYSSKRARLGSADSLKNGTSDLLHQMQGVSSRAADTRVVEPPTLVKSPFNADQGPSAGWVPSPSQTNAEVSFIAHDSEVQSLMDEFDLAWGTQYEIARGVSDGSWVWSDITRDIIQSLRGSNEDSAPHVNRLLGPLKARSVSVNKIWTELDREQAAITENRCRGLGLQGEWHGETNWFGGQIQQIARVVEAPDKSYRLRLEKMEMRKSHRFARYLGSRHLMQFKLPDKFDDGDAFLMKKFILCGRVFVPFCVKDGNVYLLETKDNFERHPLVTQGDQHRPDFSTLIKWHNPMQLNGKQSVNKWIARFDLGLSTSVPVLKFAPENVFYMDDEYAEHLAPGEVPTEKIFTDGCGFMNGAALMAISRQMADLGSDRDQRRPTAVQGRVFGAKGLWVLHPDDQSPESPPRIWIRDSQIKVKLVPRGPADKPWTVRQLDELHPAHLIFDLVAPSRASTSARLSRSTITNLSHNGVNTEVLKDLLRGSLERELTPLLSWTGPHANVLLHHTIDKTGRVTFGRVQRAAAGAARALGLTRWLQDKGQDIDELEAEVGSDPTAIEDASGLHEKIICALQAGFSPLENVHLYEDFRTAVNNVINKFVTEYHISIPASADAFIVPDPYGVLEEGEIHFKASRNLRDPQVYQYPDVLTGDVLIYRNPCRLPSDVQKVKAVQHASLSEYIDVIVLPTKGVQSLASLLAGGDVDGDVAVCIYEAALVDSFRTHATCKEDSTFLADNFEPVDSIQTVQELLHQMNKLSTNDAQNLLQRNLLSSFNANHKIGKYSKCHENAAYAHGYDAPITLRLAFMFNTILDSRKSGLVVKHQRYSTDMQEYNRDPPECFEPGRQSTANSNTLLRKIKGHFILDVLMDEGRQLMKQHIARYDALKPAEEFDEDLLRPYQNAKELCSMLGPSFAEELQLIRNHVEDCCQRGWSSIVWKHLSLKKKTYYMTVKEKRLKAEETRKLHTVAREYALLPPPDKVPILSKLGILDEVKGSYAYLNKPNHALRVAFRTLCIIKAKTKGLMPMTISLGLAVSVPPSAARLLSSQAAEFGGLSSDVI